MIYEDHHYEYINVTELLIVTGGEIDGSGKGYGETGREQLVVANGGIKGRQKELTNEKLTKIQMDEDGDLTIVVSFLFDYAYHPGTDTVTVKSKLSRAN